jgi:hypothetical protein
LPLLAKSYRKVVAGQLQYQQSTIASASNVDVSISSLKPTTGKNADVAVFTTAYEGFVTVVNEKRKALVGICAYSISKMRTSILIKMPSKEITV